MKRKKKLTILIVLVTAMVFVWAPKGKKTNDASPHALSASFNQAIPIIAVVPRRRTEFADWPRDPFAKLQTEEEVDSVSDLKLGATMWGDKESSAFINGKFVSSGDKIDGRTVKQIEWDSVVLTDGINDYVLELSR